jgi:vitamin B12 transporter
MQVQRRLGSGTTLGGEWIYASQRRNGSTVLPAYNLINLSARLRMGKTMWFEGRVENLFDEDYELRSGYNTSGRAFYLGLNYAPDE